MGVACHPRTHTAEGESGSNTTQNPAEVAFLKWTCEIEVHPCWFADGFELTEERLKAMIENELPHSYGHETRVKVTGQPSEQERKSAEEWADQY